MNVKVNDNVLVLTGKYAGQKGKVLAASPKNGTVLVEGINIQKKSQKARKGNDVSKIIEKEGPVDASNVMVICDACSAPVRVKYAFDGKKKYRVCPKCGAALDKAYAGKAKAAKKEKEEPKKRVRKRAKKAEEAAEATADKTEE